MQHPTPPKELRTVLTVQNHAQAVSFFRDVLGLPQLADWSGDQGKVVLLDGGHATLELVDAAQSDWIDQIEVGEHATGAVRIALAVEGVEHIAEQIDGGGAEVLADAVDTPWGDRNVRLRTADGVQLTLFSSPTD